MFHQVTNYLRVERQTPFTLTEAEVSNETHKMFATGLPTSAESFNQQKTLLTLGARAPSPALSAKREKLVLMTLSGRISEKLRAFGAVRARGARAPSSK